MPSGAVASQLRGVNDQLLEDKEFFVHKALGWVLRSTARGADEVFAWLWRRHQAARLTLQEAAKYLSEAEAQPACGTR